MELIKLDVFKEKQGKIRQFNISSNLINFSQNHASKGQATHILVKSDFLVF